MCLTIIVIGVNLIRWMYNRTCVALRSTLNVVAISVATIGSRPPDTNANSFPLLPQLVNSPDLKEPIVNRESRIGDGGLLF